MADFIQPLIDALGVTATLGLALAAGLLLGALVSLLVFTRQLRKLRQEQTELTEYWQKERVHGRLREDEKATTLEQTSKALKETKSALERLREKADKAYYMIMDLRKEKESLTAQRNALAAKLADQEASMRRRIGELEGNLEDTKDALSAVQEENTAQEAEIEQLRREKQAVIMLKEDFESGVRRLEELLRQSKDERAALQEKNARLIEEFHRVERTQQQSDRGRQDAETFVQSVRDEMARLVQENASLRDRLNEADRQLETYRQESVAQDEKYGKLLDEFQVVSSQSNQRAVDVSKLLEELDSRGLRQRITAQKGVYEGIQSLEAEDSKAVEAI